MSDTSTAVDTYLRAYGEPDPDTRRDLLAQSFNPEGQLADPPLDTSGLTGINDMMAAVQQQFPGHVFRRTSEIDGHHGFVRYGWELIDPEGRVALAGMDVGELDADDLLFRVTGFFGPLPELA